MAATMARWTGIATRIMCALALLSLAFSIPAEADARALTSAEVVAYMLPDGSLPSLCVTVPDGSGQGKIVKLGADSLGLYHSVAALPVPDHNGGVRVLAAASRIDLPETRVLRHLLYPPGAGPRAPPAFA
jgi:hypothetical protein